jgi:cytidine deaminase
MQAEQLSTEDRELLTLAESTIRARYVPKWNQVAAAVRVASGKVYVAINLDTHVGIAGICAEPIAIGQALMNAESPEDRRIVVVASVRGYGETAGAPNEVRVVSPCGRCRELLADYGPDARIVVPDSEEPVKVPAMQLLPSKYTRE